jgi:hypothetical protein
MGLLSPLAGKRLFQIVVLLASQAFVRDNWEGRFSGATTGEECTITTNSRFSRALVTALRPAMLTCFLRSAM